ncbi:tail terminator [Escherichia phage haarsle]|uniref:Minor tail protein n=1 Tax=Escherichia phage haarsle TaxID=2696402 RepID=A0A6B9WZB6_9CAUD|nr:tail terminator [Escherichia phage haarsle]QHR69624.1 minor tail protein [Escherichia phage haarsle]
MHYELMLSARKALATEYENRFMISYENVEFTPPGDGSPWLKFDYTEVDTEYLSLDRKCVSYIGMIQVGIVFPPGYGTDRPRVLAKEIAQFFYDGKMLEHGYIYEGARVHKPLKSESGWILPIRFYVRIETKE